MSEDDTFRRLKRTPFIVVVEEYNNKMSWTLYKNATLKEEEEFFSQYGWTPDEYWDEFHKRYPIRTE